MDIVIIGLPQSGKSTLFNALTLGKSDASGASGSPTEMHLGAVKVPDPRLDYLTSIYRPRKTVPAEIRYTDLPGPEGMARSQGIRGRYRNILQSATAFLIVVRTFQNDVVVHPTGSVDPARDLEAMLGELSFADLEVLERASTRLADQVNKTKPAERPMVIRHKETVEKARAGLENGVPVRLQSFTDSERAILVNYQLLTDKQVIAVFNTDEGADDLSIADLNIDGNLTEGVGEVSISARIEADLCMMDVEEAEEFRADLGLGESATTQVIRASYGTLGLVSFLTVGEDEVRAWSVPGGMPAVSAAGVIHTDFTRGFIRAEVIAYDDYYACGSMAQGRKEGLLRSEGKTYPVKDGDIINFLVNT
jgi:GTP-binding protein YchF